MRFVTIVVLIGSLLSATFAVAGDKEDYNRQLAEEKIRDSASSYAEVAGLPVAKVARLSDVFTISLHNKDLLLHATTQPTEGTLLHVAGMSNWTKLKVVGAGKGPNFVMHLFSLENRDFSTPGVVAVYTMVDFVAGDVHLVQMSEAADSGDFYNVELIQHAADSALDAPHVTLNVQMSGDPEVKLALSADNVVDLRRAHPAEVAKYVDPILSTLQLDGLLAHVDSRLAWQVFPEVCQPTQALRDQVKSIVAKLDADRFQDREAASHALEQLGQPAALVLAGESRSGLSAEQNERIDAFIAKYRVVSKAEAARMRDDPEFLLDCLTCDELPLRTAALERLKKLTGKPITFDLSADTEHRISAATALRQTLRQSNTVN